MARFEYRFIKATSGRLNKGAITAFDEDNARAQLAMRGISVEMIERLPPDPATERQADYLRDLGVALPAELTKDEASDLIDNATRHRDPAPPHWRLAAAHYKVEVSRYAAKISIASRIVSSLLARNDYDALAEWYSFRVYRSRCNRTAHGVLTSPDNAIFGEVGRELLMDKSASKSLILGAKQSHTGFLWFGDYLGNQGDSDRTGAYKSAASALEKRSMPAFGPRIIVPRAVSPTARTYDLATKTSDKAGCLGVAVMSFGGLLALGSAVSFFL